MIDNIVGPFQYGFMMRALIVSVLVGVMCPVLGAYVITRGRAFMGDALAHSVLPAMVVAFLLGVSPFVAAVPGRCVRRCRVVEHVGHQGRDTRLVANRRKLSGRAPDETQPLQGVQSRVHRPGSACAARLPGLAVADDLAS